MPALSLRVIESRTHETFVEGAAESTYESVVCLKAHWKLCV